MMILMRKAEPHRVNYGGPKGTLSDIALSPIHYRPLTIIYHPLTIAYRPLPITYHHLTITYRSIVP